MKLAHTRIATRDVAVLAAFYRKLTGVAPAGTGDDVEFHMEGSTLALSSQRAMERYGAQVTARAANRSAVFDFQVADVDRERARLKDFVHEWILEPALQPWGSRSMLFRGPDGNLINFFTPARQKAG